MLSSELEVYSATGKVRVLDLWVVSRLFKIASRSLYPLYPITFILASSVGLEWRIFSYVFWYLYRITLMSYSAGIFDVVLVISLVDIVIIFELRLVNNQEWNVVTAWMSSAPRTAWILILSYSSFIVWINVIRSCWKWFSRKQIRYIFQLSWQKSQLRWFAGRSRLSGIGWRKEYVVLCTLGMV